MNIQFTLAKFMSEPWWANPRPASSATSGRLSVISGCSAPSSSRAMKGRFGEIRSSAALRSVALALRSSTTSRTKAVSV